MIEGLIRAAAATPEVRVADPAANCAAHAALIRAAAESGCSLVVFPELSVTAYTCGDLFRERLLLDKAEQSLSSLMQQTAELDLLCAVGVPVRHGGKLFNCAAVFLRGTLLGLASKSFIPNYGEFYEARYFAEGRVADSIRYCEQDTIIGSNLLFACQSLKDFVFAAEICEDLWISSPPSIQLAQNGATVIGNLSCSNEVIGKAEYRRELVKVHSGRLHSAYIYSSAGLGESTTDLVFAGHNLIAENGVLIKESEIFSGGLLMADLDLQRLSQERLKMNTWLDAPMKSCHIVPFTFQTDKADIETMRIEPQYPFVPSDIQARRARCEQILSMQTAGLCTRLRHTGMKTAVIAFSGGLDSTLALLVTAKSFDLLGLPHSGIHTVSMPGFGTTKRTKNNAREIANALGANYLEISIVDAILQHFKDIGHDPEQHDVTYENAQARERMQIAMDIANKSGGLVVGTGDLSELALGWSTYNGDHMSMYGVNASVPKTLVRYLVEYCADSCGNEALKRSLYDVLDTPISPELLPPKDGEIVQKTEEIVGPYVLHDYFLYYLLRFGFTPKKIYTMALLSFQKTYAPETIKHWMKLFYQRFFAQQFKRSCLPDGPKIGSVSLSPRGDFRMPSDACAASWLAEIDLL